MWQDLFLHPSPVPSSHGTGVLHPSGQYRGITCTGERRTGTVLLKVNES